MYRKASDEDLAGIVSLWSKTFGDSEEWAAENLYGFVGAGNTFVSEENGTITAILNAVPCEEGGRKGVYLYALATAEEKRGQGLMGGLMEHAENEAKAGGAGFACLIPASAPLFGYYAKRGYTLESRLRYLSKTIEPNLLATASFDTLTAKGLNAEREKYFPGGCVTFGATSTAAVMGDLYASGASTAQTDHGYAVYFEQGDTLLVAEMAALSTPHANLLLQAIQQKTGCGKAVLTLAAEADIYNSEGKITPHALFKQLDSSHHSEAPYLRFGFEELRKEP